MGKRAGWAVTAAFVAVLAGCGSDDPAAESGPPGPREHTVVARDIAFKPDKLRVPSGTTVTWRFEDRGIPHDVKAEDGSFKSDIMDSGTFEHTFDQPGTYPYICTVHPAQMKAVIEVR